MASATLFAQDTVIKTAELVDYTIDYNDGNVLVKAAGLDGLTNIEVNKEATEVLFTNGVGQIPMEAGRAGQLVLIKNNQKKYSLHHISENNDGTHRVAHIPLWLSILPPIIAIALALIFKEVLVSLFIGIWAGAFIAGGMKVTSLWYWLKSIWMTLEKYILNALTDGGHMTIVLFSILIGGMVAIISRNGGMAGVVQKLSRFAKSPRSTQFVTWLLGVAIFFDDYANTLIVGNTMRSVTDKFKISREKLAYIVDSTAAPVAAIAFITTWIGAELSYIEEGIVGTVLEGQSVYSIFLSSLKYSFYPVLTLIFILIIIYTKRDFGKMYQAEHRARTTGKVSGKATNADIEDDIEDLRPVAGAPLKWYNAGLPVFTVIGVTILGLLVTGINGLYDGMIEQGMDVGALSFGNVWSNIGAYAGDPDGGLFMKLGTLIGTSDSYIALTWASLSGVIVAIIMTLSGKIMSLEATMTTMMTGFKTMLPALTILALAWALAATTKDLGTAQFLSSTLADSINPYLMPAIIFVMSAFIAFSTGSSWSTMAILYPIAIPTTWAICQSSGVDAATANELLLNVIAVVLAASVLGDHCSPISDTTILSSLASDCNHIDHVRTQMPYALTVGGVSIVAGVLSTFLGGGWWVSIILMLVGVAVLYGIVRKFGKVVDA